MGNNMERSDSLTFSLRNQFKYTFDEPITVEELIDSLKGYEKLIVTFLPRVLNTILGTEISGIIVRVEEIEQGSLIEKFIFDFLFGSEENYKKSIDKLREKLGLNDNQNGNNMRLILIISALLSVGAIYYATKKDKEVIRQNIINIINANGDENHLSGEEIVRIIEASTSHDKKEVAQNTSKVVRPAQTYKGNIEIGDSTNAIEPFSRKTLRQLPKKVEIKDFPITEPLKDIDVQIRATDRDKSTGWYGIIDGKVERRVKLILPSDVDRDSIANNATIRADVTIHYKINKKGEREAYNITIDNLIE